MTFEQWAEFILLLPAWMVVSSTKVSYGMMLYAIGLGTGYILAKHGNGRKRRKASRDSADC